MKMILFALLLAGCQSMAAPEVPCTTSHDAMIRQLDKQLTDAMYDIDVSGICKADYGSTNFTECPAYHREWREYWAARRSHEKRCGDTVRS